MLPVGALANASFGAGTDFTFFTTVTGIVMVIAGGGGMAAAGVFGFPPIFVIAGALAAGGLVLAARLVGAVAAAQRE